MSRLQKTFERLRAETRTGLITFLPVGFPDLESTVDLFKAMVEGGADIVELGVPFSDPLADGVTIQRASFAALSNGTTLSSCLDTVAALRKEGIDVPLVPMGYYNPILSMGVREFGQRAAEAGVDGLIVVDLPPEESDELLAACRSNNIDLIYLLAPTSTDSRIKRICSLASGFIYCVSITGITGARNDLPEGLPAFLDKVRQNTELPLVVGFGVSTREHVETIGNIADAAVVGSAMVETVEKATPEERLTRTREYVEYLAGRVLPAGRTTQNSPPQAGRS